MFLSMIIPVYNTEKYLAECLDSCLAQDIPCDDYEIICINDGSKDGSLDILRSYEAQHPHIIVIDQPNSGVSAARNAGMRHAKGNYVWFVDSDDFIQRNCLGHLKQEALLHNADRILFSSYFFGHALTEEEKTQMENHMLTSNASFSGLWRQIFRRSLLVGLFFHENIAYGEDVLFIRRFCLLDHKHIETDEILYFYRENPSSAMHSSAKDMKRLQSNTQGAIEMRKIYHSPGGACEANANILINFLNNALLLISKNDHPDAKYALQLLQQEKLFPCKKPAECTTKKAYATNRTDLIGILYNWMCVHAHTRCGFYLLKLWNALYLLRKGRRHV